MRVTIAQINTTNGDIARNVSKVIACHRKGERRWLRSGRVTEVVTHEAYFAGIGFQDRDIIEHVGDPLRDIIPATVGITAVLGTIRQNEETDRRLV
ncbi:MAG: hypothetical protein IPG58_07145 [Acidobacteria bacterium]|nr:hypothetical protein [Acidobacteriota bacterium]